MSQYTPMKKPTLLQHMAYMKRALRLAQRWYGFTSPNPSVGAVIVRGKEIIGEGFHKGPGTDHAEVMAIKQAGSHSQGATLYVTLEPCSTYGRTPPCTDAIMKAGIKKVVFAIPDPNPKHTGRAVHLLKQHGISVESGVLENEAAEIIKAFSVWIQHCRPYVHVKTAVTLDGKMCAADGSSQWITGEKARQRVHIMRLRADAVLVGQGTLVHDNPRLTVRDIPHARHKKLLRVVVCHDLSFSPSCALFKENMPILLAVPQALPDRDIQRFMMPQVRVERFPVRDGHIDLSALLTFLGKQNIVNLLVEGGSAVITSFLKARLVHYMSFFIGPKILGKGKPVCDDLGIMTLPHALQLQHMNVRQLDDDVLIEGELCFQGS